MKISCYPSEVESDSTLKARPLWGDIALIVSAVAFASIGAFALCNVSFFSAMNAYFYLWEIGAGFLAIGELVYRVKCDCEEAKQPPPSHTKEEEKSKEKKEEFPKQWYEISGVMASVVKHLPYKDVLTSRLVCHKWRDWIDQDSQIQLRATLTVAQNLAVKHEDAYALHQIGKMKERFKIRTPTPEIEGGDPTAYPTYQFYEALRLGDYKTALRRLLADDELLREWLASSHFEDHRTPLAERLKRKKDAYSKALTCVLEKDLNGALQGADGLTNTLQQSKIHFALLRSGQRKTIRSGIIKDSTLNARALISISSKQALQYCTQYGGDLSRVKGEIALANFGKKTLLQVRQEARQIGDEKVELWILIRGLKQLYSLLVE